MPAITNAISKVKLPNELTARPIFDSRSMHYIGHTTTTIVPTGGTNPTGAVITIGGSTVTAIANDFVTSDNNVNYLFNGTTWDKISEDAATIPVQDVTVNGTTVLNTENHTAEIVVHANTVTIDSETTANNALPNGVTATTQAAGDSSTKIATTAFVAEAVAELPQAMIFRGTLGAADDSPTITTLPGADDTTVGDTYKVITEGTYASQHAEVGDLFICGQTGTGEQATYAWTLIPSGDVPEGTVTNITASLGLKTTSGSAITDTGNIQMDLKSETALADSAATVVTTTASGRVFAVALDHDGHPAVNVTPGTIATVLSDAATNTTIANPAAVSVVTSVAAASGEAQTGETDINIFSMGTGEDAETLMLNFARVTTGDSITTSNVSNIVTYVPPTP